MSILLNIGGPEGPAIPQKPAPGKALPLPWVGSIESFDMAVLIATEHAHSGVILQNVFPFVSVFHSGFCCGRCGCFEIGSDM